MSRLSSSRRPVHAQLAPRKGGGGYTNFSGVTIVENAHSVEFKPETFSAVSALRDAFGPGPWIYEKGSPEEIYIRQRGADWTLSNNHTRQEATEEPEDIWSGLLLAAGLLLILTYVLLGGFFR